MPLSIADPVWQAELAQLMGAMDVLLAGAVPSKSVATTDDQFRPNKTQRSE
jgi:hypothetical protein